jgi:hypothetical protein
MSSPCPQCGAIFSDSGVSCADRFATLLALDHSRREPWGSRHGLAFAAYTLQHPEGIPDERLERCWAALHRVYVAGDGYARVFEALRQRPPARLADWGVPPLPSIPVRPHYSVTLADLGDFDAQHYAADLERWCHAVLSAWEPVSP